MNNEQYQQIIDEAYEDYTDTVYFDAITCIDDVEEYDEQTLDNGDDWPIVVPFSKEKFVNKCKTDEKFSNQWGLKIEERELSLNDRRDIARNKLNIKEWRDVIKLAHYKETYDKYNIPTRAISLTYKDKTIEVYEY